LRTQQNVARIAVAALAGPTAFFVISNYWVPRDFPCESIGISEVAGIASPRLLLCWS